MTEERRKPPKGYAVSSWTRVGNPGDADSEYFYAEHRQRIGLTFDGMEEAISACWVHADALSHTVQPASERGDTMNDTLTLEERIRRAYQMVCELGQRRRERMMSIPDLVIEDGLRAGMSALSEVERLTRERDEARRIAAMWRDWCRATSLSEPGGLPWEEMPWEETP